jgi:rhodanese-related sulfurtransferase
LRTVGVGKLDGMPMRVDAKQAHELIAGGVTVVDVLPAAVFVQEHLPGAVSIPLETFDPGRLDPFDPTATLLVYCFDQH